MATVVFYGLNDVGLEATDDHAYELVVAVARGQVDPTFIANELMTWH